MSCHTDTMRKAGRVIGSSLFFVFLCVSVSCYAGSDQKKRYIFIDGGAHKGESLLAFRTTNLYKQYPWEIYAIEANPFRIKNLKKIPNIKIMNKAMWIKDGSMILYVAKNDRWSSLYAHIKEPVRVTVDTFDFGQWLKSNFSTDDYIIVSLDIEGSEYEILDKMLTDGTIKYVDRFYIELHGWVRNSFFTDDDPEFSQYEDFKEKEKVLIGKLSDLGILGGQDSVDDIVDCKCTPWIDTISQ